MSISATRLRADLYRLLDQALETGEPIEIERRGVILRIVPPARTSWVDRLPQREAVIVGDPEAIVQTDWSAHWRPDFP
jgi:antitoxin (DNA-binding transcriptional repressor) of toxin-antitoxin stability system